MFSQKILDKDTIPFNKPYLSGKETDYIKEAVDSGQISGNGQFTKKCQNFFEDKYQIKKALLTTSCTDALEMAAILANIGAGDEVIMPSYTFVSTANAFILRGANIIFCDSGADHPGIDEDQIESLITPKTKVIVPVHYAGVACNMEKIMLIASKYNLIVIEDAAQAINSYYKFTNGAVKALGSIGHLATFSFHETKNIISGEGGLLAINDERFISRSEIIWEKGTNKSAFLKGDVDKYGWVDIGSSFLPSEITAAFLWAQLEKINDIQRKRINIWNNYDNQVVSNSKFEKPIKPYYSDNNAHMFYVVFGDKQERTKALQLFKNKNIIAVFHYLSLHKSEFYRNKYQGNELPNSDRYSECLLRLPLYYELTNGQQAKIIDLLNSI